MFLGQHGICQFISLKFHMIRDCFLWCLPSGKTTTRSHTIKFLKILRIRCGSSSPHWFTERRCFNAGFVNTSTSLTPHLASCLSQWGSQIFWRRSWGIAQIIAQYCFSLFVKKILNDECLMKRSNSLLKFNLSRQNSLVLSQVALA